MKHIVKQAEPQDFADWKKSAKKRQRRTYKELSDTNNTESREIKKTLKDALLAEQGWICCYCEKRVTDDDSHIEHFNPQSNQKVDPLNFENLLCSCQNETRQGVPLSCGHKKGGWFDQNLLISPLDPQCESRFAFTGDGRIKPLDDNDQAAIETIEKLGLNTQNHKALRSAAIAGFLATEGGMSEKDLHTFVSDYLKRDNSGRFNEFWTTIQYLFGDTVSA